MQPLAPQSRRQSQQQGTRTERDSGLVAPHPYAAPGSAGGYNRNTYGRSSPQPPNGTATNGALVQHPNNSESFMYGQGPGKAGTASREGTTTAGTRQDGMGGQTRGMAVYDQMARVGEQDEHGLGRKKGGFWAAFCCRA